MGWQSFYEVNPNHTIAVLWEVEQFTNAKNIPVVLRGPFTFKVKGKVFRKCKSV
jgi:hypothetical protein